MQIQLWFAYPRLYYQLRKTEPMSHFFKQANFRLLLVLFLLILSKKNSFAQKSPSDFVFTINGNSYTLYLDSLSMSVSVDIDWNDDGVFDTTFVNQTVTHNYSSSGNHTIRIRGLYSNLYLGRVPGFASNRLRIVSVDQWGDNAWFTMESMFEDCENLVNLPLDTPNLSQVQSMAWMFRGCTNLNGVMNHWDVSNVQRLDRTFEACSNFNQMIGNWDVSSVRSLDNTFWRASSFNQNLSSWNVSNVLSFRYTFADCISFDQSLSNWDFGNAINLFAFLNNTAMSVANYDSLIIHLQNSHANLNLTVGANDLEYCASDSIRNLLIGSGWTFMGDSLNCLAVGLDEESINGDFSIFPNPASNLINIHTSIPQNDLVRIFNQQGQLMQEFSLSKNQTELDVSTWPNGIYFLQGKGVNEKLVVQH